MKITEEQLAVLRTLRCERLSSDVQNIRLVNSFENYKNPQIAVTLKNEAFTEDEKNIVAYYVVKSSDGNILFYFSLKCGLLYDEFIEGEKLEKLKDLYQFLWEAKSADTLSDEDKSAIDTILEGVRAKKGLKLEEVARILQTQKDSDDFVSLFDTGFRNVGKTFAGVEIVHFCANDETRDIWTKCCIKQKLGTVVFWYFIVQKIIELEKIAGCEYIFLFAADNSENEELVNYYTDNLQFKKADRHSVAIPLYDFTCKFMYQITEDLDERRKAFFEAFNPDEDSV